jgi:hypothetical protein
MLTLFEVVRQSQAIGKAPTRSEVAAGRGQESEIKP